MPPLTPPAALVFDLDGTLLDSFEAVYEATVLALRDVCGVDRARAWSVEHAREHEGKPESEIARLAAGSEDAAEVARRYRARFPEVAARVVRPFEDALPAIEALSRAGVLLAVATNKPAMVARELLERFGLAKHFRAILGAGEKAPAKPHPWLLVEASRALGVPPRMIAFVGDTPTDVATARAANAHAWLISRETREPREARRPGPEGADRVLRSLEEIPTILAEGRAKE